MSGRKRRQLKWIGFWHACFGAVVQRPCLGRCPLLRWALHYNSPVSYCKTATHTQSDEDGQEPNGWLSSQVSKLTSVMMCQLIRAGREKKKIGIKASTLAGWLQTDVCGWACALISIYETMMHIMQVQCPLSGFVTYSQFIAIQTSL